MIRKSLSIKYIITIIIIILSLSTVSCLLTDTQQNQNVSDEETHPPPSSDTGIYIFETKREALQILSDYIYLNLYPECYEEQSYGEYKRLVNEVIDEFANLDVETASEYVAKLNDAYENIKYVSGSVPRIYIETGGIHIKGESYSPVRLAVIDSNNENNIVDNNTLIKIRGQSTAGAPKKPYTFKFGTKESLLGMSAGKRWVLLANAFDKTLMRNKLVLDFCKDLNFLFVPDSTYVELWVDGEYQGNYLLTQPVTDDKARVPVNKNNNEFMIEIERDRDETGVEYIKTELYKIRFKIAQPESPTSEQINFLNNFMNEMEDAIASQDHLAYEKFIDIASFIDYNIVLNYFKDVDAEYSSTNFFLKDGRLYAGPPWDFDLALGNVNPSHNNPLYAEYNNIRRYGTGSGNSYEGIWADCIWFEHLLKDEYYYYKLTDRYNELQPLIENLYIDNDIGENRIDMLLEKYSESFHLNYSDLSNWSMTDKFSDMERHGEASYIENTEYLREWLKLRNEWLAQRYLRE